MAFESFYGGAIGGSVIALFFLVVDSLGGRPLLTPSILGSTLFLGESADTVIAVRLDAVAYATVVHFAAFGLFGLAATRIVRFVEVRGGSFLAAATTLFVITEVGFVLAANVLAPGLLRRLGQGTVLVGNLLTAVVMTLFLRSAHSPPAAGPKEDIDDTMDRASYPT
jgi:hypothetical protein